MLPKRSPRAPPIRSPPTPPSSPVRNPEGTTTSASSRPVGWARSGAQGDHSRRHELEREKRDERPGGGAERLAGRLVPNQPPTCSPMVPARLPTMSPKMPAGTTTSGPVGTCGGRPNEGLAPLAAAGVLVVSPRPVSAAAVISPAMVLLLFDAMGSQLMGDPPSVSGKARASVIRCSIRTPCLTGYAIRKRRSGWHVDYSAHAPMPDHWSGPCSRGRIVLMSKTPG